MMKKVLVLIFIFLLTSSQGVRAEGTYSSLGTTDAADGSNDAINFSQGRVWTIDQYGKYIWLTQTRNSTVTHWAWSNNLGANWTQGSENYTFLTRASVAYDSINDKLHVIWAATDTNDGIIYRRYGTTRDGSNNITAIVREDSGTVNLQLDTSSSRNLDQPVAMWVNDGSADGTLVAIWPKGGAGLSEVRGSMRRLSMTAADGVAGNWVALDGSADTFAIDAPLVAADKIYTGATGNIAPASASVRGGSGLRKDDLYVFVAEPGNGGNLLAYRAAWNSGSLNWSGGWQSAVTMGAVDNNAGGYNLKYQLLTKPVIDSTNDRLYVGWARWKTGGDGDTVSIGYLNSIDTASSVIDIYAALGTHTYAPTIDIAFDATLGNIYAAYIESTTNGDNGSINYKTYNGTTLSGATRWYTSPGGVAGANGSADIPILYESRTSNNRLLFGFRINGNLPPTGGNPHSIYWGYETLPTPTPTPTPAPTATPVPVSSSSSSNSDSSGGSGPPDPNCKNGWAYCVASGPSREGVPGWLSGLGLADAVKIYIPAKASYWDVYVVAKPAATNLIKKPNFNMASDIYELKLVSSFNGYSVGSLNKPAIVSLPYDIYRVKRGAEKKLKIAMYDTVKKRWNKLSNSIVNIGNRTVSVTTTKFGYMTVVY